ncbi:hypothetical protein CAP48_07265 [Advenella sp. S44]|uniref:hypothetical protein n=1 Tax=Advenella sp. S44 TaxID=1982755 RepID=UPI000C2B0FC6|nr:hypothetical protein [Advenella sp. S44]PJX25828.1 hypothetical protein CAP48_07265 [Advenella sp. S44]
MFTLTAGRVASIVALGLLAACSTGTDHSKSAECGRINSRVMMAPAPGAGDNFLSRNSADQRADAQRERARRMGCD